MIRCAAILVVLLLAGCGPSGCAPRLDVPAAPPAAPAAPAATAPPHATAPRTGNAVADGVSDAKPADVVAWLLPWLAGILTVCIVGLAVVAAWLRSRSLATLAASCAVGLALVLVLKLVLWVLAALAGLAVLAALAYLARELWLHRAALARHDPLHCLLTRKA